MEKEKKTQEIAVFRYGLIAMALHLSRKEKRNYFRELESKEFEVPYYGKKKYRALTFNSWLLRYKNGGLANLAPTVRSDSGKSKKITAQVNEIVKQLINDFPYLSISGIYRMLIHDRYINAGEFGETTLRYYIHKNKLKDPDRSKAPRKKFEKDNVNELWTADFMVGPYIIFENKKRVVYLCGIIDDHSRMIVGFGWYFNENCIALANTLKKAIAVYGIPDVFYTDNGSAFSTNYLHLICARMGIALVHSKPYDSPSRGNGKSDIM